MRGNKTRRISFRNFGEIHSWRHLNGRLGNIHSSARILDPSGLLYLIVQMPLYAVSELAGEEGKAFGSGTDSNSRPENDAVTVRKAQRGAS